MGKKVVVSVQNVSEDMEDVFNMYSVEPPKEDEEPCLWFRRFRVGDSVKVHKSKTHFIIRALYETDTAECLIIYSPEYFGTKQKTLMKTLLLWTLCLQ